MAVELIRDLKTIFHSLVDMFVYPLLDVFDIDVSRLTVEHLLYVWSQITIPARKRRKRSFVRFLGTIIPFKPPKRLRLQTNMLVRQNTRLDFSMESHSSGDVVRWLKGDVENSAMMVRDLDYTDLEFEEHTYKPHALSGPERTSTPVDNTDFSCSVSALSAMEPVALQKITALEEELAMMRNQIASLVMMQEQNKSQVPSTIVSIPQAPPPAPPPPPPPLPPPAPPCPSTVIKHKTQQDDGLSLADLLKKNKDSLSNVDHIEHAQNQPVTMADVIKNLGKVKLRSVKRSPGGTPIRPKRRSSGCTDPSSLIARAIQKKFKHNLKEVRSPQSDKENEFSSPEEKSPKFPFGQHILKKTKRRSLLAIDPDDQKSGSPLKDINC